MVVRFTRRLVFKVPIEKFLRQANPDPKVVEQLRSLGCKEFGIETEADVDEFIRTEIPHFELVRARGVCLLSCLPL